jgi:hypothetical protein
VVADVVVTDSHLADAHVEAWQRAALDEGPALAGALWYAKRLGALVAPADPAKKKPTIETGKRHAEHSSRDPAVINGWKHWKRPGTRVCVITGPASGLLVVDADRKPGVDGVEALAELERTIGLLPETPTQSTTRGEQRVFRYPPGRTIKCSAGKIAPGVDIRGEGGIFIAPPAAGRAWRLDAHPTDLAPADLPAAWVDALEDLSRPTPSDSNDGTGKRAEELRTDIPEGSRNADLFSLAGSMRRRGCDAEIILAALRVANKKRCRPPLGDDELQRLAQSAERYDAAAEDDDGLETLSPPTARTLQAPEFPPEAMPGAWGELVALWAPWTDAHPASIVLPGLIICGVKGGEGVQLGRHRHRCTEYLYVIGDSTFGRKDSGCEIAREFTSLVPGPDPVDRTIGSGEGVLRELRDPTADDPGAPDKRQTVIDTEIPATMKAAHRQGATTVQTLCALWDRGTKGTTTRDPISVTNAHFSFIGLGTPDGFNRNLAPEDREGLLQRTLLAAVRSVRTLPASKVLHPEIDQTALVAIAERVTDRMTDAIRTRDWRMSPAACDRIDEVAPTLAIEGRPETSRGLGHVTRLAMLYCLTVEPHPDEECGPGIVALSHLEAAIACWRYCVESGERIFGADPLLDKIYLAAADHPEGLMRSALLSNYLGRNVSADELDRAIARGVNQGRLRIARRKAVGRGRPPEIILPVGGRR